MATNAASVTPRAAVAAGSTIGIRIDSSFEDGCDQLLRPFCTWSTTSTVCPTRSVTAWSASVTVMSNRVPELGVGVGLPPPPMPAAPHAVSSRSAAAATTYISLSGFTARPPPHGLTCPSGRFAATSPLAWGGVNLTSHCVAETLLAALGNCVPVRSLLCMPRSLSLLLLLIIVAACSGSPAATASPSPTTQVGTGLPQGLIAYVTNKGIGV